MTPFVGTVRRTTRVTPGLVRLTVQHPSLADFPSTGVGDEFVRVYFPDEDGTLRQPVVGEDGSWNYEGEYPHVQPYTIRRFDRQNTEIDLEFVVHGHGRAAHWAATAEVGDSILFGSPRGLYDAPTGVERCVFVTDATGIPALGRLLEQLDESTHALAVVEIAEDGHQLDFVSPARLSVQWIVGRGNGVGPSAMTEALAAIDLDPSTYVWVAGEAGELRSARRHLRHERQHPADRYKIIGYWRHEQEEWLSRWNALDEGTLARLRGVWDDAEDEEVARDLYDGELERLGL